MLLSCIMKAHSGFILLFPWFSRQFSDAANPQATLFDGITGSCGGRLPGKRNILGVESLIVLRNDFNDLSQRLVSESIRPAPLLDPLYQLQQP